MRAKLTRIVGWTVAIGLLALIFWRIDVHQVLVALHTAAWWTFPVAATLLLGNFLADCFATWKIFGWFTGPLVFRELMQVRGASYLLAMINYSLGQGALVYYVHRARQTPVMRAVATVLLMMGSNLLLLLALTSVGLLVSTDATPTLRTVVQIAYAGLAVYAITMAIKPRWLERRELFRVLMTAGLRGHLGAMLVRLPHVMILIAINYVVLRGFGVDVTLVQAVVRLPAVFFISALPISVQGLGTSQAMMILLFAPFVTGPREIQEATVLAASLGYQALGTSFQVLFGLIFLRSPVVRDLRRSPSPTAATKP